MKHRFLLPTILLLIFFGFITAFAVSSTAVATEIKDSVLRFHVVANSNEKQDQANKFAVRDGIASLCEELFKDSSCKEQSMQIALQNKQVIEQKANGILKQNGSENIAKVTLQKRYFPTRHYEGVSLPAGVYDTIDVQIGKAEGENFWCVMFPEICVGASAKKSTQKMSEVLSKEGFELVSGNSPKVKLRFKIIEVIEYFKKRW